MTWGIILGELKTIPESLGLVLQDLLSLHSGLGGSTKKYKFAFEPVLKGLKDFHFSPFILLIKTLKSPSFHTKNPFFNLKIVSMIITFLPHCMLNKL